MPIVLAAGYGALAGLLVPRAAYRLAVPPARPWRDSCPAGHPLPGPARGWIGPARCAGCATGAPAGGPPAPPGAPAAGGGPDVGAVTTAAGTPGVDGARYDAERRPVPATGWYGPDSAATAACTALLGAALCAAVGTRPELVVWLLLTPFLLVLALVDRAVHRLPDVLTLTLPGAAAALLGAAALLPGHAGSWPGALLGAVALGGAYGALFLIHPSGMGFGDVKLALTLGVALGWYGWPVLFAGAFAGFLLGALYGGGLLLSRRAGRGTALPFGPFMVAGAFLGLLLGGLGAGAAGP